MVRMGCLSIKWALHGESFHVGSIKTNRNGFDDDVAPSRACKIVLRMLAGSYPGFNIHEPDHW